MRKNRAGYICLVILMAAMFLFFGKTYLLWILCALILLMIITTIAIKRDAEKIHVKMNLRNGSQEGKNYKLGIEIDGIEKLRICGYVLMEVEMENQMLKRKQKKKYLIPLSDQTSKYHITMEAECCGEVKFICKNLWAVDYFHLFYIPIKKCEDSRMIIYPRNVNLQVELSKEAIGATREDVNMQSREGNDPSEMYDVREYIPGDDIRSVHWKLSSKVDQLLLRQSSDPTHYNVVLLPDFGVEKLKENDQISKDAIECLNGAIAITTKIGRELIRKRESFCLALPTEYGLQVLEVQNERQLKKVIANWLSTPIPEIKGTGLRYFSMQHLEQYFSRLVVLSSGEYEHNPNGLEKRIGITIVSCVKGSKIKRDSARKINEITEILADLEKEKIYRIIC